MRMNPKNQDNAGQCTQLKSEIIPKFLKTSKGKWSDSNDNITFTFLFFLAFA